MKVSIITIHALRNNFGSVLQGYALCRFLNENGHDASIINYQPKYFRKRENIISAIKSHIINSCFVFSYFIRKKKFDEFISYSRLTQEYYNLDELLINPPVANCYIAGSDQLWNPSYPCGQDDAFFLSFINSPNKLSYATSLGTSRLNQSDYANIIKKIHDFAYVSVRENISCLELRKYGRPDAEHVCDPVFLLPVEHYRGLYNYKHRRKYLLVYAVEKDNNLREIVDTIAHKLHCDIITVGGFRRKSKGYFPRWIGPKEFLGFLDNAEFVVVSSFHGTAFSLIFEKQFIVVPTRKNVLRISSILDIVRQKDRIVNSLAEATEQLDKCINYTQVRPLLNDHIMKSKKFLLTALQNISHTLYKDK